MPAPANPTTPTTAMVPAEPNRGAEAAQDLRVMTVAGRADKSLERFETVVTIPADYQYAITKRGKQATERYPAIPDETKVGLTVDGYDYLNRVVGATFFLPEKVHDEKGVLQLNPIHRPDYIYLRMGAVWYTPLGQLVSAVEDIEVDFEALWQDKRANSWDVKPMLDADGQVRWDAAGRWPLLTVKPEEEIKALRELTRMRSFGPRYAVTVARVRLLKMATGIRSLPIDRKAPFQVRVIGYRDQMQPEQRVAQVAEDTAALYGRPSDIKPLTAAEAAEVDEGGVLDDEAQVEQMEREQVARQERQEPQSTTPPAATPVGPAPAKPAAQAEPTAQDLAGPWSDTDIDGIGG